MNKEEIRKWVESFHAVEQEEFNHKVRERVLVELETTVWDSDWFHELVEKKVKEILEEKNSGG